MTNELGFKDLYQLSLKTTYFTEMGGKTIQPGEVVAVFDKIQLANFQEIKSNAEASGGFDNRSLVHWSTTKEIRLNFTQGVFSKSQLALMTNANLIVNANQPILVDSREVVESGENGEVQLKQSPKGEVFVYDAATGIKISNFSVLGNKIAITEQYKTIIVDYQYEYTNNYSVLTVGQPLTQGYLSLFGKMRVKDDTTGKVVTGIIRVPKLRLMSDLSMRVGSDAIPQVGRLDAVAIPEGVRGKQKTFEVFFLSDDIDADM